MAEQDSDIAKQIISTSPTQVAKLELVSYLEPTTTLPQVQNLLQHALDHDGYLPIGEHIYLKLRAGQTAPFAQKIAGKQEAAAALLAYLDLPTPDHELSPHEPNSTKGPMLVGYSQLLAQPHNHPSRLLGEIVVHPHLRGRSIGRQLLDQLIILGKQGRFEQLDIWAYHARPSVHNFARHTALVPTRTLHHMRLDASAVLPDYELPADLRLRSFRPGIDDAEWLALNHLVFADHPENGTWTQADLEMRFSQPWFDPDDFLVVEDESGRMLGFNWTKRVPARVSDLYLSPAYPEIAPRPTPTFSSPYAGSEGEIYIVGLHPDARGRGLGRGLTLLGLHHLRSRDASFFALYVDATNTPAVNLYLSLGFTVHHDDVSYSLKLAP